MRAGKSIILCALLLQSCGFRYGYRGKMVTAEDAYRQRLAKGDAIDCAGGRYRAALKHYSGAEALQKTAEVAMRIGDCNRKAGKCGKASKAYDVAMYHDGDVFGARIGKALCEPDSGKALELLAGEEKLHPERHAEITPARQEVQRQSAEREKAARDREQARFQRDQQRQAAKRAEEEKKRRMLEAKAKLQSQGWKVGQIQCGVITVDDLGKELGNELATTTASGVFVGVLVKCTNVGRRTQTLMSSVWSLVDGSNRQYAVDTQGSTYFLMTKTDESQRNPEFAELHPGVETTIALIFDVPPPLLKDPRLALNFKTARFDLQPTASLAEPPEEYDDDYY